MRKTQSTPCFLAPRRRPSSAVSAVSPGISSSSTGVSPIPPSASSPPTAFLMEHIEAYVSPTLYQFVQCMEAYGPARDILRAPHPRAELEASFQSVAACMLTPDEPSEPVRPPVLPQSRLENVAELNERFDRLFLSVRRQRRRQTV